MYKFLKSIALVSIILLQVIQANAATLTVGTGSGYQVISGNGAAKPSVAVNDDGSWNVCWLEGTNYYCKGYNSSDQATIQKTLVGDVGSIPNTASALLYGNIKTVSLPTTGEFFVAYNTTLSSGVFTYELKRFTKAGTQIPIDTVGTVMSITGNQTSNATWNQFSGNSRYLVSMFLSWDGYLTITDSVLVSADGWNTGYHVYRVAGGNFTAISGVNGTGVYGWTGTDPYIYVPRMWCRHPSGYGPDNVSCALVAYNNTGYGAVGLTNVTYVYGWDATTVANWFGNRTSLGTS